MFARALSAVTLLLVSSGAFALTLKIGTMAPEGSPWDAALRELGGEWADASGGGLDLKLYAGGIAGDESDMIRKMRLGELQGAALSQLALGEIVPDVLALDTPFLMRSDGEFEYVLRKMRPYFEREFDRAGYELVTWSGAGWVHFFANRAISSPDDLRRLRLGVPAGDDELLDAWRRLGFHAYQLPISDLLPGLEAGTIDAFYAPPTAAALFRWFLSAAHMSEIKVAPVVVAFVVDKRAWKRIPEGLRSRLLGSARASEARLDRLSGGLDASAIRAMVRDGLTVDPETAASDAAWRALARAGAGPLIGKLFSREAYDEVVGYVDRYRAEAQGARASGG